MNTPFKLKSGNKPEKSEFFGNLEKGIKKLFEHSPVGRITKKAKKAYESYKANKPK